MQQHSGKVSTDSVGRSHLLRYFTVSGGLKCLYYSAAKVEENEPNLLTWHFFCSLTQTGQWRRWLLLTKGPNGRGCNNLRTASATWRRPPTGPKKWDLLTHCRVATGRMNVRRAAHSTAYAWNELFAVCPQCRLHIHASYSTTMKMNVPMLPLAQPNAVGLILAHGKIWEKKKAALKVQCVKIWLDSCFF